MGSYHVDVDTLAFQQDRYSHFAGATTAGPMQSFRLLPGEDLWRKMRTFVLSFVMAVLILLFGSGLVLFGYTESSRMITLTQTSTFLTSTTSTSASIRTESFMSTRTTSILLLARSLNISGIRGTDLCGYYDSIRLTLDAGEVHGVVRSSTVVDFWILNQDEWSTFELTYGCDELRKIAGLASRFHIVEHEFTAIIPSTGPYYFAFLNKNNQEVSIDLKVDRPSQIQSARIEYTTSHVTYTNSYETETLDVKVRPSELGPPLGFGGAILLIVGIIAAGFTVRRKQTSTIKRRFPSVSPIQEIGGAKICKNCGTPQREDSKFCETCGKPV